MKTGVVGVGGGHIQAVFSAAHIQEGKAAHIRKTQGNIQVPQTDVAIDTQDLLPHLRQCLGDACAAEHTAGIFAQTLLLLADQPNRLNGRSNSLLPLRLVLDTLQRYLLV